MLKKSLKWGVCGSVILGVASSVLAAQPVSKKITRKPTQYINRVQTTAKPEQSDSDVPEFTVGFQGGAMLSNWSIKNVDDGNQFGSRIGAMVGINGEYNFSHYLTLRPELNYIESGASYNEPNFVDTGKTATYTYNLRTLQIPIFLKVIDHDATVKPFIMAGPNASIIVGKSVTANLPGNGGNQATVGGQEIKDMFSNTEFGANVAGGAEFELAHNTQFAVSGRYHYGLSNVISEKFISDHPEAQGASIKQRGFQFLGGVQFKL